MKRIAKIWALALFFVACGAHAQTGAVNGYCTLGATSATTSGLPSSNKLQGLIPQCTVTVYLTGTLTKATLYQDASDTPLTNPFTADTKAKWLFFVATGQGYDIVMSGGFPPLTYPSPVTYTDVLVGGGGGTGTVVEVNGTPIIVQSPVNFVNSPTVTFTNPSLGIIQATAVPGPSLALQHNGTPLINQAVLNFDDTTPAPPAGDLSVTFQSDSTGKLSGYVSPTIFQHDATNLPTQSLLNFWDSPNSLSGGSIPAGNQPVIFANDAIGGIAAYTATNATAFLPFYTPPTTGAHVLVFPNTPTVYGNGLNGFSAGSGGQGAGGYAYCTSSSPLGGCNNASPGASVTWTFTLPSYINSSNITAMYLHATSSGYAGVGIITATCSGTGSSTFPVSLIPSSAVNGVWSQNDVTMALTTPSSVNVSSISCVISTTLAGSHQFGPGTEVSANSLFLDIYDSVDSLPAQSFTNILYPLVWQGWDNAITLFIPYLATVDNGTSTAYSTTNTTFSSGQPAPGSDLWFLPANTNITTNPTLSLNGGHTFTITKNGGALNAGDIVAGTTPQYAHVIFDGTYWQLQNPQTGFGVAPSSPAFSIQIANSAVNGLTSDPNILINTTTHSINIGGALPAHYFTLNNLSTITSSWTEDVTSPTTAFSSILGNPSAGIYSITCADSTHCTTYSGTAPQPAQITTTFVGVPGNSQVMYYAPATFAMTIASSCTNSKGNAAVAATGSTAFLIKDLTTSTTLCTATFSASGTTAAYTGSGGSIAAGDIIEIIGPSTADATLATIGLSVYATR